MIFENKWPRKRRKELGMKKRIWLALVLLSGTLQAGAQAPKSLATRNIWRIGTFNHSSSEFQQNDIDYTQPISDVTFVVGKNSDADWHAFQPGPANGTTGGRLHPYTIHFTLNDEPTGVYTLHVAMLYETPRLSSLRLNVNGREGDFFLHPKLNFDAGDWAGTFVPQTSTDEKSIQIPAAWLHRGENVFVLTAIDDPATPQNSMGAIAPGHTGLTYDALELTQDPSSTAASAPTSRIEPTIFYRAAQAGEVELVDVFLTASKLTEHNSAELYIGTHVFHQEIATRTQFGELRIEFAVPTWKGSARAIVRLNGVPLAPVTIAPAKKWTIAIIPHEHLDIGFTDYPAKVAELHSQSVDQAMELIAKRSEFRWTLDGSWVADEYMKGRTAEARQQFIDHVRAGSITVPPQFANLHTGNASWEALARSLYGRNQLAAEYKLPATDAAHIVDVPSYTWGYASLLHDAGIKYFVAASNSWRAPAMLFGHWNEKSPFYWEGPDGSRVLMWYARAYLQAHTLFGGPWRTEAIRDSLPVFLQAYTRPDYTANTAIIFGTQLENTPLEKDQSEMVATFNQQYAWPRLEYATVHSAMQQIETDWKGEIPVVRGDFGPYWEDGYGSDAAHTAIHRQNQHRITSAEVLGSAIRSLDTRVQPDKSMLDDAWQNELVYDEHTWTHVGATSQAESLQSEQQIALKQSRVERARKDIDESLQRTWAQLEALVKPHDNSIAVFNSLNWNRTGMVEADIPEGTQLADANGALVPLEVLHKSAGIAQPGFGPPSLRVRFLAADVPAVGYKLFTVKPIVVSSPEVDHARTGNVLENAFYRVTLDPSAGAISSIFDKQLQKELVDQTSPYRFGSYLYVSGGDSYPKNSLYRFGAGLEPPTLTPHSAASGKLISLRSTPLGEVATLTSSTQNTPSIETEILLPAHEKAIHLTYHLHKDRVLTRESAYIAFPFGVASPQFGYASQTGWIDPAKDELAGGSREWYLATTWAAVHNAEVTAAVIPEDAPLVNFGDIVRGAWPAEFKPKGSTIFSWLMNNYWNTNFPAWQGGDFTFRYVVTSDADFAPASLTHTGWNSLTPLEHDDVAASTDPSALPSPAASLLDVDSNVTMLTWKGAEDGDGTIVRLQESTGKDGTVTLRSRYLHLEKAWLCNLLEQPQSPISIDNDAISIPIKRFQVLTIRLRSQPNANVVAAKLSPSQQHEPGL
jgi:alpha-mannosidase